MNEPFNVPHEKFLLPEHMQSAYIGEPFYRGHGIYSVAELEQLCQQFTEFCYQQRLIKQEILNVVEILTTQLQKHIIDKVNEKDPDTQRATSLG